MENEMPPAQQCGDGHGTLPECAPLSVPFVPFQQTGSKRFETNMALNHGTLFPGLDLPFRSKAEPTNAVQSALNELQALEFVIVELGLYLDTHQNDTEAFALFRQYVDMESQARKAYTARFGPLRQTDAADGRTYTWLKEPWPWNFQEGGAK